VNFSVDLGDVAVAPEGVGSNAVYEFRYKPGQIIPWDGDDLPAFEIVEPPVLDVLRVANGVLSEEYLLPMYAVSRR
jgi:hypothetical protein